MHLIGLKKEDVWIFSRWELTYPVGWDNITKAVASVYDYYDQVEVLADGEHVSVGSKDEIKDIPEDRTMTIRGISKIVKAPIMITFYNQLQAVDVNVPLDIDEFRDTDYEKFNHSLCQYMDSIELAMHR